MPVVRTDGRAGGRSVYGHVITKFSRMGRLPHFLTHGAPLRALRARELRYYFCYLQKLTMALNNPCTEHLLGGQETGAPNDSFLLNTLKTLFRRAVEMHSRCRYNICICSVILGELESFQNYTGLSTFSPKILDAIWLNTKVRHFLIPFSITFLNPKILGFVFSQKNSLTWEIKCENLTSENRRDFLDKLRKL